MLRFGLPGTANAVNVVASVGSGKSETAVMADPKPNFGDKQKPLFSVPLKWRKLVGKPQVQLRGIRNKQHTPTHTHASLIC